MAAGEIRLEKGTKATIISSGSTLATATRKAADYDNSTNLWPMCNVYLEVEFDTSAPSANSIIGELWLLPGDGEGTEKFPEGGDGTTGEDDDPQGILHAGSFETINPDLSTLEQLCIPNVALGPGGNRFVLKNVSGQTFGNTYTLYIVPFGTKVSQS